MYDDTIAAIATPLGEGGIAVVRVSGPDAFSVADQCFRPRGPRSVLPSRAATHTVLYGEAMRRGRAIDEVLVTIFRAPRSYTREDTAEIACHGGVQITKMVLDGALEAGARLAHPGEFTKRAFINGRIDLTQAEAVADLIHAQTDRAAAAAKEQLAGRLAQAVNAVRDQLMAALAHMEAHIDFPDEDIAPDTAAGLTRRIGDGVAMMERLLATADEGRVLRRGLRAVIIGRPNAGKSSLLNQLLGQDRAIVSGTPGTTRDTIEETANIRGLPILFIDTAGLRASNDHIEKAGVERALAQARRADLIIHVIDRAEPLHPRDQEWMDRLSGKARVIVLSKGDRPRVLPSLPEGAEAPQVTVCGLDGAGVETLKDAIVERVRNGRVVSEMAEAMINSRHQDALQRAAQAARQSMAGLTEGLSLELPAMELRIAATAIGEIVGKTATEDLLDSIFSQFCLGK